jgi:putative membrane protein
MFLEILIAILLGVLAGTFTGLTPGIHTNLISVLILSFANHLLSIFLLSQLIIVIIAMSITHTFVSSIPSIYLGAPSADLILTALPGHQLLLEGRGHTAVCLTVIGGLVSMGIALIISPLIFMALPLFQNLLDQKIGYVLLALILILLLKEKKWALCFLFFILSGIFGIILFQLPLQQPLLALLSGCFGVSLLLLSLQNSAITKQKEEVIPLQMTHIIASSIATIAGFFAAFLPGFGASQAAIYASQFVSKSKEAFLVLSGGINTIAMFISLFTFYLLHKARNGSIVSISEITIFNFEQLVLLCIVCLIVSALSSFLTMQLSIVFATYIRFVPYTTIVWSIIVFITVLVFYFDSALGLCILALSTLIGISAQKFEIPKHYLLGSLLVSVLFYFL